MRTDREELIVLREAMARIAQASDIAEEIPGVGRSEAAYELSYEEIHRAATTQERGWNRLAACIVGRIIELRTNKPQTE